MAMKGRRIINFNESWSIAGSGGLEIWVLVISFWKSEIGWPQQPLTEKVLKFNMIFHDSSKIILFSKHQNKAEFKDLDDSLGLRSDFLGLRTSAVSMTSTASMTSVASMTSTASIHQNTYWSWCLDHSWHPNDQCQSLFVEWIIKIQFFHLYLIPFSWRLCWGRQILLFHKMIIVTQISNPPESAMDLDLLKLRILLPFIAIYFRSFRYETPCTKLVFTS